MEIPRLPCRSSMSSCAGSCQGFWLALGKSLISYESECLALISGECFERDGQGFEARARQRREQGAADQRQCLGDVGVAHAGAVLAPHRITLPVVLVLDRPIAAADLREVARAVAAGLQAAHPVASVVADGRSIEFRNDAPGSDELPGEGEVDVFCLYFAGVEVALFDAPVVFLGAGRKRGGSLRRSSRRLSARRRSPGWLSSRRIT